MNLQLISHRGHNKPLRSILAFMGCFLLLAFTSQAQGQVYRCEHDGKVAFSDHACDAGDKQSQRNYATSAASGALDLNIVVNYYDVQGHDYNSLARSLSANGPSGFHGLTSWKVKYEYTTTRQRDTCQIATVRVSVNGTILMPRWSDAQSAPLELQQRWRDYYAALKRHEDGHIQNGKDLALLVKERLMGIGAAPCDQMQPLAENEFQRVYDNLKGRDQEYDARTNHGATQGARF